MFETNLHDERFLPFEGAGAISAWKLDLPSSYPAFDYSTISDVILHIRYTARLGVGQGKVKQSLDDLFSCTPGANFGLLFSLSRDFPVEWSAFVNGATDFIATIQRDFFPYFTQGKTITITSLDLYGPDVKHHTIGDPAAATTDLGDKTKLAFAVDAPPDAAGPIQVLTRASGKEIFLIVRYSM